MNRNSFQGLEVEEGTFDGCFLPNQESILDEQPVYKWKCLKVPGPFLEGLDVYFKTVSSEQE